MGSTVKKIGKVDSAKSNIVEVLTGLTTHHLLLSGGNGVTRAKN